jgi:hypothetical protein
MNQAASKRLDVTLLDIDSELEFSAGILTGIITCKTNTRKNKKKLTFVIMYVAQAIRSYHAMGA